MKKILAMVLALVLCLSLCACGADKNVAGDYESVGIDHGNSHVYRLNENGTYENATPLSLIFDDSLVELYGEEGEELLKAEMEAYEKHKEKGIYEIVENGFKLTSANKHDEKNFIKVQDSYYTCNAHLHDSSIMFDMDNEYGKAPTFSKDGKCGQEFEFSDYGEQIVYVFTLREDGTFTWSEYDWEDFTKELALTTFEGTYSLDGSVLTLTFSGQTYVFLYTNDIIFTRVYKKVA